MVRKKKTSLFHNQLEPESAERRYKILKAFLLVAGISLAVGIVGVILHNALYGLLEREEPISFGIGLVGLFVFFIAIIGSLVVYITGRRKPT
jgi:tellurite resistance protein TehA-like permease